MPAARNDEAAPVERNARVSSAGILAATPISASDADRHVDQEYPVPAVGGRSASRRAAGRESDRPSRPCPTSPSRRRVFRAERRRAASTATIGTSDGAEQALHQRETRPSAPMSVAMPHSTEATVKPMIAIASSRRRPMLRGEPAGGRRRDRGRDDVRGQHPGNLVLRAPTASPACRRQRDVRDGRVDDLHHRGEHHRERRAAGGWRLGGG